MKIRLKNIKLYGRLYGRKGKMEAQAAQKKNHYGGGRGNGIKKCDPLESHRIKVLCKSLLHRGGEECSVAEYIEDVFGCRNEERLALFDSDAIDVSFSPEAYYYDEGVGM